MREAQAAQQKRLKRSAEERQMHEDTVPESCAGIYSTGTKDKMGRDAPRFVEFRSLPINVQDDLGRAEILPTTWPRCRISGYERVFHYRLMTVIRKAVIMQATCHQLTRASVNSMYPPFCG